MFVWRDLDTRSALKRFQKMFVGGGFVGFL